MEPKVVRFSDKTNNHAAYYEATFSHCGRFLAMYSRGKPWPELVPLKDYLGPQIAAKRRASHSEPMVYSKRRRIVANDDEDEDDDLIFDEETQASDSSSGLTTFNNDKVTLLAPLVTSVTSSTVVVSGGSGETMTSCKITSNEVEIHSKSGSEEIRTPVV